MKKVRALMTGPKGRLVIMGVLAVAVLVTPAVAQTVPPGGGGDPFGGIIAVISNNLAKWSGALLAVGLLGLAWQFMSGSQLAGERFKGVLFGSLILIVTGTVGGVLALITKAAQVLGGGVQ